MKRTLITLLLAVPFAVSAADGSLSGICSMKASKMTPKADLEKMATVKHAEAKKIASDYVAGGHVTKGGIETEDGCLIYSFHVKEGKGQKEVFVDAGNGKVLGSESEGKFRTAMEKPVDKAKELAGSAKEAITGTPSTNQAKKQ